MSKITQSLSEKDVDFIKAQKMFFVATAPKEGRINLSPKGLDDTFKIINENKILWLNYFGSGNETAAHLLEDDRMTLMFCAYEGKANILRLYCKAKAVQEKDANWGEYISHFSNTNGARQVFEVEILSVNNSCGYGVPLYEYKSQRKELVNWMNSKTKEQQIKYMKKTNQISIDGKQTGLFE